MSQLQSCANCGTPFNSPDPNALEVVQGLNKDSSIVVTALCPTCLDGAKVIKIVLQRNAEGVFGYTQFTALEMQNKAFRHSTR